MKLALPFIILLLLFFITYYFEEYSPQQSNRTIQKSLNELSFKKINQLKKIILPHIEINRDQLGNLTENQMKLAIDQEVFDQIIDELSRIKVQRILTEDEIQILKQNDVFKNREQISLQIDEDLIAYHFGLKTLYDDSFYFKIIKNSQEKWFLAKINPSGERIYFKNENPAAVTYASFLRLISNIFEFYLNKTIVTKNNWRKIKISNQWNRSFTIDVQQEKTRPPITSSDKDDATYQYDLDKIREAPKLWNKLKAIEIWKKLPAEAKKVAFAQLELDQFALTLDLYQVNQAIYLVKSDKFPFYYRIDDVTRKLFFSSVQEFWKKYTSNSSLFK